MKKILKYNSWLLGIVFLAISCTEYDGDERPIPVTPKLGTAKLNLIMAVTTADDLGGEGVDFWVDETNLGPKMQPGDVVSMDYEFPQGTMFRSVIGGKAPKYLSNPISSVETILTWWTVSELMPATHNEPLQGQLKDGASYTIINTGFGNLNHDYEYMVMVEDDLTPPASGQAKVRFVHASGGECWNNWCIVSFQVGGVDLGTSYWGGDSVYGASAGQAFTDFVDITPGSLTVDVIDGGGDPYWQGTIDVAAGGIYTVVFSGNEVDPVKTPEPNKFNLITH
ncbi:MAG: DUF4397 domain-containing protein [Cyclobacteriaceae bacterium]